MDYKLTRGSPILLHHSLLVVPLFFIEIMLVRREEPSLVFNSQASSATDIAAPQITDTDPVPSSPITTEPTPVQTTSPAEVPLPDATIDSTKQPGAVASSPSSSSINLGTVIGACMGSVAILILIVILVVWHTRRNRKSIRLNNRPKRDNWNKLSDNQRDSQRSSFVSKPSLPPLAFGHSTEYPPGQSDLFTDLPPQSEPPRFVLPAHPYSSIQAISSAVAERNAESPVVNPFADPGSKLREIESDVTSIYSAASNPFESVYTPPTAGAQRSQSSEGYSRSPFFTPHPDSSVREEKWGLVGKERNVQESYAPKGEDKLGSLIAALALEEANSSDDGKADRSMHGHLGKL